ncbi:alginate export family protein [Ornithobacterium rhinotracheale]|uniref:alginate export family protein n=1 Tax=Ornithobacterium rhinotracheale TaxID=28251 RepID=UPI001FF53C7F|nr:alginate export family protein [Ornithobacterium rhinotracheale]MCK0201269.1 alginate export family protein [Ornithobacterium rhinotracheale]UVD86977.1 alginate export family protein [Ornithobacterium rhinotracheale]
MKKSILSLAAMMAAGVSFAQLSIDANLKTRFEYRHGQADLYVKDTDPATFVSQRTRLGVNYKKDFLELQTSLQNVSVWGDAGQPGASEGVGIYEAWAKLGMGENFSLKLGRQPLSYDDERILGALDWAQTGRTHDAALLSYNNNGLSADAGFAYNQTGENKLGNYYDLHNAFSYKTMQYLHLNRKWAGTTASVLMMNNSFQDPQQDRVYARQTLGGFINSNITPAFNLTGSVYYQTGKAAYDVNLSAYQARLELNYIQPSYQFGLGAELLSGTKYDETEKSHTFVPLYGTNHGFNGFMDYFYVGNYASPSSKGLNDFYGKVAFNVGGDAKLLVQPHVFLANAQIAPDTDKYLGTEVDLVYSNSISKDIKLNVGYSHMFAAESMELVKGGKHGEINNWAWVQLYITPNLFKSNK